MSNILPKMILLNLSVKKKRDVPNKKNKPFFDKKEHFYFKNRIFSN